MKVNRPVFISLHIQAFEKITYSHKYCQIQYINGRQLKYLVFKVKSSMSNLTKLVTTDDFTDGLVSWYRLVATYF